MREVGQPSAVGLLPVLAVLARTEFFARLSREEAAVAFRRRSIPRLLSLDLQDLILIQMPTPSRRCLRYRSSVPASSGRLSSSDVWWRTCQSTGPPYTSTGRTSARSRRGGKRRSRPSIQGRRVKDQRSYHHVCRRRGIYTPQSERCKYSGPQHLEHQVPEAHVILRVSRRMPWHSAQDEFPSTATDFLATPTPASRLR